MSNGNGKQTIFTTVIALIIVAAITYGGLFIVSTKEALAVNKREHQIFEQIAADLNAIRTDVAIIKKALDERFGGD